MTDNRLPNVPLEDRKYSTITASLANYYCTHNDCEFMYYSLNVTGSKEEDSFPINGYQNVSLPVLWIKVKAVSTMLENMEYGDLALFVDTDFVFNQTVSIQDFIDNDLKYDINKTENGSFKSFGLCWDHYSFWTAVSRNIYSFPVNAGVILFSKTKIVEEIVDKWWKSAIVPSALDLNQSKNHAMEWPHDQDRLTEIVSSGMYDDEFVFFKEGHSDHPSIGIHGAFLWNVKDFDWVYNYSKVSLIPNCSDAQVSDEGISLNGCDEGFGSQNFTKMIVKHAENVNITYLTN